MSRSSILRTRSSRILGSVPSPYSSTSGSSAQASGSEADELTKQRKDTPKQIGRVGAWVPFFWRNDEFRERAFRGYAQLEAMGYDALWASGGHMADLHDVFDPLLASTQQVVVASAVISVWEGDPAEVARLVAAFDEAYPGRFLL